MFDISPRLSVGSGCELESARAHKNFDIVFDFGWQPAANLCLYFFLCP